MSEEKKKKVLIVEDDLAIIDVYKIIMEKSHLDVRFVSLGQDAIKIIKDVAEGQEARPDIILLDLILPDVNGMDILKEIRANDKTKDIKVFIFSNQEQDNQPKSPSEAKPDRFIIKSSITPSELVDLLEKEI